MECNECFRYLRCYACEKLPKCDELKVMAKRKECFVCDMDCDEVERMTGVKDVPDISCDDNIHDCALY